jgi:uncharacterized protein YkwD
MGVRGRIAAAAAAMLIPLACSANAKAFAGCPSDTVQPTAATGAQATAALVCDINVIRARRGLRPLHARDTLAGAAQAFAQDLAAQRALSHISLDGRSATDRIFATGYFDGAASWLVLENVAWANDAYSTPLATATGWMQSTPHRANLLDPQADEVGIGIAPGQMDGVVTTGFFYVADFAARGNKAAASKSSTRRRSCKRRRITHRRHRAYVRNRCRTTPRV